MCRYVISFSGCNRGFVSRHDLADTIGHLYLCESSSTMLKQAEIATDLKVTKLEMDEENPKVCNYEADYCESNIIVFLFSFLLNSSMTTP